VVVGPGRHIGRIKSFNPKKGFGFIDCPEASIHFSGRDVFIHKAQIGDLEVGCDITFFVEANRDGFPQARDIRKLDGRPPGPPSSRDTSDKGDDSRGPGKAKGKARRRPGKMPHLSFNESINPDLKLGKKVETDATPESAVSESMPLAYKWTYWEQPSREDKDYSELTQKVLDFSTVQEFWKFYGQVPQPSMLLGKRLTREQPDGVLAGIDSIMIFRDGIRPEWEDKVNATGGHFQFQLKPDVGGAQLDEYWNNLVLGIIGSGIAPASMITGIRLVDKLSETRGAKVVRIEVWFSNREDAQAVAALKKNVEKCMAKHLDGSEGQAPWCATKNHSR